MHTFRNENTIELLQQERFNTLPFLRIQRVGQSLDAQTGHLAHVRGLHLKPHEVFVRPRLMVHLYAVSIMLELQAQVVPLRCYKPMVDQGP